MNTVERIKERLADCDVVLAHDKWKANYKEDVLELVQGITNLQMQSQMLLAANSTQAQVMDFLVSSFEHIEAMGKKEMLEADESPYKVASEVLAEIQKLLDASSEQPELLGANEQSGTV